VSLLWQYLAMLEGWRRFVERCVTGSAFQWLLEDDE